MEHMEYQIVIIWLNFKSIRFKLIKFNKNITTTKSVNFIINIYYQPFFITLSGNTEAHLRAVERNLNLN